MLINDMRRDELNRMACGWIVRGGTVAAGCSSMGGGVALAKKITVAICCVNRVCCSH